MYVCVKGDQCIASRLHDGLARSIQIKAKMLNWVHVSVRIIWRNLIEDSTVKVYQTRTEEVRTNVHELRHVQPAGAEHPEELAEEVYTLRSWQKKWKTKCPVELAAELEKVPWSARTRSGGQMPLRGNKTSGRPGQCPMRLADRAVDKPAEEELEKRLVEQIKDMLEKYPFDLTGKKVDKCGN